MTDNERVIKRVRFNIAWRQSPYLFKTCVSIPFATEHFLRPGMQFRLLNLILKGSTWFTVTLNATVQQTQPDIFEMQTKSEKSVFFVSWTWPVIGQLMMRGPGCGWTRWFIIWGLLGFIQAIDLLLLDPQFNGAVTRNFKHWKKRACVVPIALTCALLPPSPSLLKACRVVQSTTYQCSTRDSFWVIKRAQVTR